MQDSVVEKSVPTLFMTPEYLEEAIKIKVNKKIIYSYHTLLLWMTNRCSFQQWHHFQWLLWRNPSCWTYVSKKLLHSYYIEFLNIRYVLLVEKVGGSCLLLKSIEIILIRWITNIYIHVAGRSCKIICFNSYPWWGSLSYARNLDMELVSCSKIFICRHIM